MVELCSTHAAAIDREELTHLPILMLHLHARCNCRCQMCDIWKTRSRLSLDRETLETQREALIQLGVQQVVFTGGEPLLNPDLLDICMFFKELSIHTTLLTSGLLLRRYAALVAHNLDEVIISIDGPPAVHDDIRNVPGAFQLIAEGVRALRIIRDDMRIGARCTIQKKNHAHLVETVDAVRAIGVGSISFLAVDLASQAFNRELIWPVARQDEVALTPVELGELESELAQIAAHRCSEAGTPFVVENNEKLSRIVQLFRAHLGAVVARSPQCNAPWVSAVWELGGEIRPCFFHQVIGNVVEGGLLSALNSDLAKRFRGSLDVGSNDICKRCVCSLNYSG